MAEITPTNKENQKTYPKSTRMFIGRGWINETPKGKFINAKIDTIISEKKGDQVTKTKIDKITISTSDTIQLWPNENKRKGKKDADYRISVLTPEK